MISTRPYNSLSILVVEDNYADYLILKETISLLDFPVAGIKLADTLGEALKFLKEHKPDVVFLDLYLPDSNGLDSFDSLKELATGSAIIILSGLSDTKTAREAISLGAQDYLAKGEFDEKLLGKTIVYSIERKRNMEILREANERYSLVTKATHDLIWDWDLQTGEVYCDEKTTENERATIPYTAFHHIDNWHQYIHPDDVDRLFKALEIIKQSDKDFFELEYRMTGTHGGYRHIYDRGYVVRNAEGKAIRLIGAAQDITEKLKLEAALRESRLQQQRAITEATIKGQEKEREQLGAELHDNINQILATSKLYLDYAISVDPSEKDQIILKSQKFISQATEEIRRLSKALLPPTLEEFGLISAIEELIDTISLTGSFQINKEWGAIGEQSILKDQKLTIYRIVQEQLNNIIKHAGASQVKISLRLVKAKGHENLELMIKDDGKGFDPSLKRNGVGIRNITSRAELFGGKVSIQSRPGQGCELKVVFPGDHSD